MNSVCFLNKRSAGSVLIVVLFVCLGLVSLTLVFGHSMMMAYRGSDNELAARQADLALEGAAQYAITLLTNVDQPGDLPDPATYQSAAVPLGEATFWFLGEPLSTDTSNVPAFGLVDEASKLNLNTATAAMLMNLPGMTQDLADAIVSWRTVSSGTSGSSTTASSTVKMAPFETVEELAQVNGGTDLVTLYGNDTNLNHVLDPNEATDGPNQLDSGLMEYLTVFSREPNTLSDGTARVNVTRPSNALASLLNTTFGSSRGQQIEQSVRSGSAVRSVLQFFNKSGMTATEFGQISAQLSMTDNSFTRGLINVNTASATVLACVPGLTADTAAQLVAARESQTTPPTNLAWAGPILGPVSAQAGPYLTGESFQVSADVAAVGHHGRGYRRTLFVIDSSLGTPQIVYRRNLAPLGWALGAAARETLAKNQTTP